LFRRGLKGAKPLLKIPFPHHCEGEWMKGGKQPVEERA